MKSTRANPTQVRPSPEALAAVFCRILNEWLDPATIAEVNARNVTPKYEGCCATHDFCDPNQAMIDAAETFGLEFDFQSDADWELINSAWDIARIGGFQSVESRPAPGSGD